MAHNETETQTVFQEEVAISIKVDAFAQIEDTDFPVISKRQHRGGNKVTGAAISSHNHSRRERVIN